MGNILRKLVGCAIACAMIGVAIHSAPALADVFTKCTILLMSGSKVHVPNGQFSSSSCTLHSSYCVKNMGWTFTQTLWHSSGQWLRAPYEICYTPVQIGATPSGLRSAQVLQVRYRPPTEEPSQGIYTIGQRTKVRVVGNHSDLIDIISNDELVWRDYVRQDTTFDPTDLGGNDILIAARAGRNDDLLILYGLVYLGRSTASAVDVVREYLRDGKNISVVVSDNTVKVTYGRKQDLRIQYSYSEEGGWLRSSPTRNGGFLNPRHKIASERMPKQ